jgi:hypothetical protein
MLTVRAPGQISASHKRLQGSCWIDSRCAWQHMLRTCMEMESASAREGVKLQGDEQTKGSIEKTQESELCAPPPLSSGWADRAVT